MDKFRNKYRIDSARLASWDYSNPGLYFITICTKDRINFFGEISDNEMYLNEIGEIADKFWGDIPDHFHDVELGEFIIMPNHVHGIIIINELHQQSSQTHVETRHALSLLNKTTHPRFRNPGKHTISSMVGSFKSAVTKSARLINIDFGWQSRFHDHIIRSNDDYKRISNYIKYNPANWMRGKFIIIHRRDKACLVSTENKLHLRF